MNTNNKDSTPLEEFYAVTINGIWVIKFFKIIKMTKVEKILNNPESKSILKAGEILFPEGKFVEIIHWSIFKVQTKNGERPCDLDNCSSRDMRSIGKVVRLFLTKIKAMEFYEKNFPNLQGLLEGWPINSKGVLESIGREHPYFFVHSSVWSLIDIN